MATADEMVDRLDADVLREMARAASEIVDALSDERYTIGDCEPAHVTIGLLVGVLSRQEEYLRKLADAVSDLARDASMEPDRPVAPIISMRKPDHDI